MASRAAQRIANAAREKLAKALGLTFAMAIDRLQAATPVDTHHAQSNWIGSVGRMNTRVDGSREAVSFRAAIAGRARVLAYSGRDIKAGRQLRIRNNVFYVKFLNKGSSPQAAAQWVERALYGYGQGATRHMPKGSKRAARKMLAKVARTAYKRGRGL